MKVYKIGRLFETEEHDSINEDTYLVLDVDFSKEEFEKICNEALSKYKHVSKNTSSLTFIPNDYLKNYLIATHGFKNVEVTAEFEYSEWY